MLAHSSTFSRIFRPASAKLRAVAGGLTMALAALLLITGLGMSDLTASSVVDHTDQTVNRALKGDRLPLVPAIHRFVRNQPLELDAPHPSTVPDSKLPDGCEGVVSSIANSELAHIAGRCVS